MKFTRPFIATSFLVTASASLIGCGAEDVDSTDIRTSGMYANFEAVASGDGSTLVTAELRVGGDNGTFVEIVAPDDLVASADQDGDGEPNSVSMGHNNRGERHWYESRFTTDEDETVFTIDFQRGEEDDGAPNSTVALPPGFTMSIEDMDSEGGEIQRGNGVPVTWDNLAGGTINWRVEGDCIWTREGNTADDGEFTVPADEIEVLGTDEGEDCIVEVILERIRNGDIDPAYGEGGSFQGIQRRGFEFTSTPADGEGESDNSGGAGGSN